MDQTTESVITVRKRRIASEDRMSAKALLLELFPEAQSAGQLILHFNPGRNALFCEWQERSESLKSRLELVASAK